MNSAPPSIPLYQTYTEADVERWFGAHEIAKARPYVDAIKEIEASDERIDASVQGTARMPYHVEIVFPKAKQSGAFPIVALCSCPVGSGCKHAAATLLAALKRRTPRPGQVRSEVHEWLTQLQGLLGQPTTARAPVKRPVAALYYVLTRPPPGNVWEVRYLKAPMAADGGMGKAARPWTNFDTALAKPPTFMDESDEAILRLLWGQRGRDFTHYWSSGLPLNGRHMADILSRILATGRGYAAADDKSLHRLSEGEQRTGSLRWVVEPAGIRAQIACAPAADLTLPGSPPWYVDLRLGLAGPLVTDLTPSMLNHLMQLPALGEAEARVVAGTLEKIAPNLPRPTDLAAIPHLSAPLFGVLSIEHCFSSTPRSDDDLTVAVPHFSYGNIIIGIDHTGEFASDPEGNPVRIERNLAGEGALLAAVRAVGMETLPRHLFDLPSRTPGHNVFTLSSEDDWFYFEADLAPTLARAGWDIRLPENYFHHTHSPDTWYAEVESSGNDFALTMGIEVNGQSFALAPLIHVMLKTDPRWFDSKLLEAISDDEPIRFMTDSGLHLALPAGRLKPLVRTLVDLLDRPSAAPIPMTALDAARLVGATEGTTWRTRGMDTARALHDRLRQAAGVSPVAAPEGFGAQLRPYQLTGLAWLQYLREHRLGGILADDMGLGKTAQALAHLLTEKLAGRLGPDGTGKPGKPALVVLPTSLVFNWKREAERFAPQLKVLSLHGSDRKSRFDTIADHDVVLTTYPLLWRDTEALTRYTYHTLILDEAQTVKNAASRASATVRQIQADHRLCLTGTPLENHLGELWTQFDFLLPGFLGEARKFARDWRTPIEKRGDALRREVLAHRIRPFILRRKKEDVAKELPAKNIIVRTVELVGAQRDLYETVRSMMDSKVRDEIARKGFARSQIVILDALLKLRQTCCDPRLLKSSAAQKVAERAKLDLLMAMLPELVDEGRRILVFSQFAEMLDLIEDELVSYGLSFLRLSGKTKDRETPVTRFQNGEVPIFLISLKAGGVGLNLTAADTVIHYDPWWNPAAENQATDRAHRIGQTKQVFVYKLIVAGSIEEKILALQDKKAALAEGILSDKAEALAKFSADDIAGLLAPLPT